ncbi:Aldehyde dehydrogenase [Desulfatibacillum aliphaticivorans]|uniref:Aldehyde dehydrogenase n=1 Tax=Desulfatibacillum aliphaticivorans TaxID=218208 RepID=B8FLY3_DESAL|nr:gamma-aminobutyraldehyde dehydrogenase [Desulfatibacillum aliphaticivorans]ACL05716.1 Aldehyde dehydrogenase [Desulfatibacillum aliphaticivorans]
MEKFDIRLLINGNMVLGEAEKSVLINPDNNEVITEVPCASIAQVDEAIQAANEAFPAWKRKSFADRAEILYKFADRIDQKAELLAKLESINCGKPYQRMLEDEMPAISDHFRFFAGASRCMSGSASGEYLEGFTSMIRRDPVGVVGQIAPWNYPLMMGAWKIAPALAAGNTVVFKPSECTPLTILALAEDIKELFPPGVLNILTGKGSVVGKHLASHDKVQMVSVTGSVGTGKQVLQSAASNVKRTHLELGGKAPVIAFDDCDIDDLVENMAMWGYYNAGQDCTAACRLYVQENIYQEVVDKLTDAVKNIHAEDIGPLISAEQREIVQGFVERAKKVPHLKITAGGNAIDKGCYYEPTLIADALQDDEVVQEEIFGPVVSVTKFKDVDQAIEWANDCKYGLASSIWTKDIQKAHMVSSMLQFGVTWINTYFMYASEMPHGGFKMSGYGKDLSMYGLEDYTVVRHIMVKI